MLASIWRQIDVSKIGGEEWRQIGVNLTLGRYSEERQSDANSEW